MFRFGKRLLTGVAAICAMVAIFSVIAAAQEIGDELGDISLGDVLEIKYLETATKRKMDLRKAPAIATVITADEIRNMGARDLMDVLKMVPGFGVSINETGSYMFEARGVRTTYSEKIVVMVDGHRLYDSYYGSALYHLFNDLSLEKAKQIEIVRGPGSALYGANAFVAVVNIITKEGNVDGAEVSVAGGSFNTKKISVLGGKSSGDLKVFGSFDYADTEGADVTIEADSIAGAPFSMTPGKADLRVEKTEAFLKIASGNLSFRGHFAKKDEGSFIGFTNILTDENYRKYEYFWTELRYAKSFTEKFSASLRTYFDSFEFEHYLELLTEGMPGHPDGAIGVPSLKNRVLGAELQFDLDMSEHNHLIFGFNFDHIDQYDVTYIADYNQFTMEPLGSLQDVTPKGNYCKNVIRKIWAAYIQDEWEIRKNLNLTAGVRYDYYDDFGSTVNPRAGLVWNFWKNADMKLLYGQAFRAPNFAELYTINNPVGTGNPDLEPETVQTYEASLGYRFGSHAANINYFHSNIDDQIFYDSSSSSVRFANMVSQKIDGIEITLDGKYSADNYWKLSYTWQDPKDADTDEELPNVPSHRVSFSLNWGITKYLNAHTDILWTGKRPRVSGDTRDDMPSYTTVDMTLIAKNFYKNLEIRGMIHNLFDEEYEDPDMSGAQQLIPDDYPRAGISALVEFSYRF